jgi:hypothetical protein
VPAQRLGDVAALERLDHGQRAGPAEVRGRADDPGAADREQRQGQLVLAGVERQPGLCEHFGAGAEIALGVLDADDPLVLGQAQQGVGLDRRAGADRDVVEQHR